MVKKILWIIFICIEITSGLSSLRAEETQSETDNFKLTLHNREEIFPFGGLETLEGEAFDGDILKGKYALITLWSTWCPYCEKENPSIQELYEKYSGEGFAVVTIALGEEKETVENYMEKKGYTFPVILDMDEKLKGRYAPRRPCTYIIDGEGYITAEIKGWKDWVGERAIKILGDIIPHFREGAVEKEGGE